MNNLKENVPYAKHPTTKCFKTINFERFHDQGQEVSRGNVFQIPITLQTMFSLWFLSTYGLRWYFVWNVCVSQDKWRLDATSELSISWTKLQHSGSSEWLLKV